MNVVVIGGGAVGLCCAYFLRLAGAAVTIVERTRCGAETSSGNAGWLTRSLSAPSPGPGVVKQSLKWMLDSESPFYIRPRADLELVAWLWRFARACTAERLESGTRALLAFNQNTFDLYDGLRAQGIEFSMYETGLLFASLTEHSLDEYSEVLAEAQRLGYDGAVERLDGTSIREFEPALSDAVVGGLFVPSERHVRPESLCQGLASFLGTHGVDIREHEEVVEILPAGDAWTVRTATGDLQAEKVVCAAGPWSSRLLARTGIRLPLEGAKGYSLTMSKPAGAPRHAIYFTEAKVGCSPFDDQIRFGGTLELTGFDRTLNERRMRPIERAGSSYLRDWHPGDAPVRWAGLRPLSPDGLPYIGAVPESPGLFVATGHSHLGITLAAATGAALAPLVLEGKLLPALEPFRADRRL